MVVSSMWLGSGTCTFGPPTKKTSVWFRCDRLKIRMPFFALTQEKMNLSDVNCSLQYQQVSFQVPPLFAEDSRSLPAQTWMSKTLPSKSIYFFFRGSYAIKKTIPCKIVGAYALLEKGLHENYCRVHWITLIILTIAFQNKWSILKSWSKQLTPSPPRPPSHLHVGDGLHQTIGRFVVAAIQGEGFQQCVTASPLVAFSNQNIGTGVVHSVRIIGEGKS